MFRLICCLCLYLCIGCVIPIQSHYRLKLSKKKINSVCFGEEVLLFKPWALRINRTRDLSNIYGGQIDAGYEVIKYLGILPSGNFLFRIYSVDTHSNENTVNRYFGGSTILGPSGPRYLRYGKTTRVAEPSHDMIVNRNNPKFTWRNWIIYVYPNKRNTCISYLITGPSFVPPKTKKPEIINTKRQYNSID
jgi:hypothetical protein